ncbi:sensor histidine kinase [Desulfoscipio gibsoniae]
MQFILPWLFIGLRDLALTACFVGAMILESPGPNRLATLLVLFALLLGWAHIRDLPRINGHRLIHLTSVVDLTLIFLIEMNSRFIINYYFHAFYLVLIVTSGLLLPRRPGLILMVITFLVSMVKFVELAAITGMPSNLSLTVFSFLTTFLIIVVITYARYLQDEREKTARLYAELQHYAQQIRDLSVTAERNRLAREIHDTVGHSLTGLIMEIEMCRRVLDRDTALAAAMLEEIKVHARDGLVNVRRAVDALRPRELEQSPMENAIRQLIDEYSRNMNLHIELAILKPLPHLNPFVELSLFRAIQEALTNAVRHGLADRIEVVFDLLPDQLAITVTDNGQGCSEIVPGNGLTGMQERMAMIGGRICYKSAAKEGFVLNIHIPLNKTPEHGNETFENYSVTGQKARVGGEKK